MEFTGERYMPAVQGEIRSEHLHRYAISLNSAKDKDVLDIACGEGYGTNLLAQVSRSVVGVDISAEAVSHATAKYGMQRNVKFMQGDCAGIPVANESMDLVVSFETIEHHTRHEEMMSEICRVLRPHGFLIISSPNKRVYSDEAGYKNPHHVKELYFEEFDALLRRHFRSIVYLGQRIATASFVYPLEGRSAGYRAYSEHQGSLEFGALPLQRPVYFLAACSKETLSGPMEASIYLDFGVDLHAFYSAEIRKARLLQAGLTSPQGDKP